MTPKNPLTDDNDFKGLAAQPEQSSPTVKEERFTAGEGHIGHRSGGSQNGTPRVKNNGDFTEEPYSHTLPANMGGGDLKTKQSTVPRYARPTRSSAAKAKSMPLEPYIRRAYNIPESTQIFPSGPGYHPPMLQKGVDNRILLYRGSFNPPHQGHLDLLRTTLFSSPPDLNIIAAVIFALDDDDVKDKFSDEPGTLILTMDQRIRLWKEWAIDRTWVTTVDYDDYDDRFSTRLVKKAKKDGFKIKFTSLRGADYVSFEDTPGLYWKGCREAIVSNTGREVDFISMNSTGQRVFQSLEGWGSWKRYYTKGVEQGAWKCQAKERPKDRTIYYVPRDAQSSPLPASATAIRSLLQQLSNHLALTEMPFCQCEGGCRDEVLEELGQKVSNLDMLLEFAKIKVERPSGHTPVSPSI